MEFCPRLPSHSVRAVLDRPAGLPTGWGQRGQLSFDSRPPTIRRQQDILETGRQIGQSAAVPSFHRTNITTIIYKYIVLIGLQTSMPGILIDTLRGKRGEQAPLWLMRQAGRYLPEYRALREEKGGFLDLVYDSEAACEVTLQPIRRFGFDGAILFSDILIVPHALGQNLEFLAGEGPRLSPKLVDHALESLQAVPLSASIRFTGPWPLVSAALGPETTMLGFAGSPWTVATYMVAGEGSRDQHADPRNGVPRSGGAGRDHRCDRRQFGRVSLRPDRSRRGSGAIVRQLGRQPCARSVRTLGDRAQCPHSLGAQGPSSRYPDHRVSQGLGRETARLRP